MAGGGRSGFDLGNCFIDLAAETSAESRGHRLLLCGETEHIPGKRGMELHPQCSEARYCSSVSPWTLP